MSGESNSAKRRTSPSSSLGKEDLIRKPGPGFISADLGLFGAGVEDSIRFSFQSRARTSSRHRGHELHRQCVPHTGA